MSYPLLKTNDSMYRARSGGCVIEGPFRRMTNPIEKLWRRLSGLPFGKWCFSKVIAHRVPYTGTIGAIVEELEPGKSSVRLLDRRRVRNHLGSIHAIALMNLAELASGIALLAGLPQDRRCILIHISMDYLKKARGTLHAHCSFQVPKDVEIELPLDAEITDSSGIVVARGRAVWKIGMNDPTRSPSGGKRVA